MSRKILGMRKLATSIIMLLYSLGAVTVDEVGAAWHNCDVWLEDRLMEAHNGEESK